MEENKIIRDTAIRMLEKEGVDLYLPTGLAYTYGITISIATLIVLYIYSRSNSFLTGFLAAFFAIFTTYRGGLLLFYVFFSGKSETIPQQNKLFIRNNWEKYIHDRSLKC